MNPRPRTRTFLCESFTPPALFRRLVGDHFEDIEPEMSWQVPLSDQVDMFLALLKARGRIGALWRVLIIERPLFEVQIRVLEAEWVAGTQISQTSTMPTTSAIPRERLHALKKVAQDAQVATLRLITQIEQAMLLADELDAVEPTVPTPVAVADALPPEDAQTDDPKGVENIIRRGLRPVIIVSNGTYHHAGPYAPSLEKYRKHVERAIAATGRMETPDGPRPWVGTAFVAGPDVICMAAHLFKSLKHQAVQHIRFNPFWEQGPGSQPPLVVSELLWRHPVLDVAFARVEGLVEARVPALALASRPPIASAEVVRVTYVPQDGRVDPAVQAAVFAGRFDGKWLMPGLVRAIPTMLPTASSRGQDDKLAYDSATVGGTGGPLIEIATGVVIGIAVAQTYLVNSWAVPAWYLTADDTLKALGVAIAPVDPE